MSLGCDHPHPGDGTLAIRPSTRCSAPGRHCERGGNDADRHVTSRDAARRRSPRRGLRQRPLNDKLARWSHLAPGVSVLLSCTDAFGSKSVHVDATPHVTARLPSFVLIVGRAVGRRYLTLLQTAPRYHERAWSTSGRRRWAHSPATSAALQLDAGPDLRRRPARHKDCQPDGPFWGPDGTLHDLRRHLPARRSTASCSTSFLSSEPQIGNVTAAGAPPARKPRIRNRRRPVLRLPTWRGRADPIECHFGDHPAGVSDVAIVSSDPTIPDQNTRRVCRPPFELGRSQHPEDPRAGPVRRQNRPTRHRDEQGPRRAKRCRQVHLPIEVTLSARRESGSSRAPRLPRRSEPP